MGVELMPKLIFATTDRAEAHLFLEAIRPEDAPDLDEHTAAVEAASPEFRAALKGYRGKRGGCECREDANSDTPYQVWSGPEPWEQAPVEPVEPEPLDEEALLDRLAAKLLERMKES